MQTLFSQFETLSLDQLNARAPLMIRRDSKYLVSTAQLDGFLQRIAPDFQLLEIDGLHQFNYHTQYLDTADLQCYFDHNKGRRKRLKLRFRHYVDSDLYFLELKLKGQRNLTQKYRQPIDATTFQQGRLTTALTEFVNDKLLTHYQRTLVHEFEPNLLVKYRRTTLVSKTGAERITIDNQLEFSDTSQNYHADPQLWIVEVKSKTGHSVVDKHLYQQKARPMPRCSKYCVGLSLIQDHIQVNRFTPVVKKFLNQLS